jgi:hypothetical protein
MSRLRWIGLKVNAITAIELYFAPLQIALKVKTALFMMVLSRFNKQILYNL